MSRDLSLLTASDLARAIRAGGATSRQAVEDNLARVEARNAELNVFVALDAAHARAAADLADSEARRGRFHGPLHGVPLAHKDMYYREGRVATCGSNLRRGWVAPTTATALRRLDAAGVPHGVFGGALVVPPDAAFGAALAFAPAACHSHP